MTNEGSLEKRITPSNFSMDCMRTLRDSLPEIQKEIPQVKGHAYFGSRTVGLEKEESDLDVVIFYDGTDFQTAIPAGLIDENGDLILKNIPLYMQYQTEVNARKSARQNAEHAMRNRYSLVMEEMGLPVSKTTINGENGTILLVDISVTETVNQMQRFKAYVDENINDKGVVIFEGINGVTFPLVSRFFLAVGDGVYENRQYILNYINDLDRSSNNGNRYLSALMDMLHNFDRKDLTNQYDLPHTIEEARKYFLNK